MEDFRFGLKVIADAVHTDPDYKVSKSAGTGISSEWNPYGISYFNDPKYMIAAGGEKITSIPSPYARMHITDIAFREYASGCGVLTEEELKTKALSDDYVKTISHCLDMFEIIFLQDKLNLIDHDINVKLVELVNPTTPGLSELTKDNPNLERYIQTLQLYRNSYNNVIRSRVTAGFKYYYDFTCNYLFKYKGVTFASTSPFTGFFTKADCNLVDAKGDPVLTYNGRVYLSRNKNTWRLFSNRDPEFLKFMYLLLKDTGLYNIYRNMFEAIKLHVDATELDKSKFSDLFPNFNLGPRAGELPQIMTEAGDSYVRPNNFDRCYLKYVLFLDKPFKFKVNINEYKKDIADRLSPDMTHNMPWLSVNDLLADSLVILPYDIDDKYQALKYLDESNMLEYRRCLIPIKQKALNYIKLEELIDGLKIRKYSANHYSVVLTLKLTTGGNIELRRDYYSPSSEKGLCCYPNGVIIDGEMTHQFIFGVYPFARSEAYENIYKVMFYNDLLVDWDLKFFYEADGKISIFPDIQIKKNITNSREKCEKYYPHNCTYYEVAGGQLEDPKTGKVGLKFAELSVNVKVPELDGTFSQVEGTSLIVPNLRDVEVLDHEETVIAIDLGTSNTYMAYYHGNAGAMENSSIRDFTTIHGHDDQQYVELEFMHKPVDKKDIPTLENFRTDSILKVNDKIEADALAAQLSEFIPARIVDSPDKEGFCFPIPSVVNRLRTQNGNDGMDPLLNRAIPFGYYSIGWRRDEKTDVAIDNIAEGAFKWFFRKDNRGVYRTDVQKRSDFVAFMSELMFIVRCNMLCNGYDLNRCKIIWTYPLSFQKELVRYYTEDWEVTYCKYFHPDWLNSQNKVLNNKVQAVKESIKSTNESLTPFFACCASPVGVQHLHLVIDMGGGSTDVIGYKNRKPAFITSFGFAGNSLYLDGNLNHEGIKKQLNYISHFIKDAGSLQEGFDSELAKRVFKNVKKIDLRAPISSIMNYGFTQNPNGFGDIFLSEIPKFMLMFHNAALFYHIAQVTHAFVDDEMPVNIYLTGNGSKLISLGSNFGTACKYMRQAFATVYGKSEEEAKKIKIEAYPNPKEATVKGALEGYLNDFLEFDDKAREQRVVALGDDKMFCRIDVEEDGIPTGGIHDYNDAVYNNVLKFIDMFYANFGNRTPILSKKEMIEALNYIREDEKNRVSGDFLSDSLFFQYISLMMERISEVLIEKRS